MTRPPTALTRRTLLAGTAALTASLAFARPAAAAVGPLLARKIPHTGEMLPVVGTGSAIIYDIPNDTEKQAERRRALEALVEGGGKVVDTAPSYGAAEQVIGKLLEEAKLRDKVFLATKVAVGAPEQQTAEMRRSLERLRTKSVDLMQLHNVRDPKTDLALLREWKAQGLCRYIGITTSFPRDYDAAAETLKREKPDFFQVNYSIADREAETRLIPTAREAGAAVMTALPFGRGNAFRLVRGQPLPDWAKEIGATSWAQIFLKFLLSNEAVNVVIPGTDKPEYMVDNLAGGRGALPDAALRAKMIAFIDGLPK